MTRRAAGISIGVLVTLLNGGGGSVAYYLNKYVRILGEFEP